MLDQILNPAADAVPSDLTVLFPEDVGCLANPAFPRSLPC